MEATPDIVTMGKPMGNGLPLAGVISSRDFVEQYRAKSRYFNTFASSPLQAATGLSVLDEIEQNGFASISGEQWGGNRGKCDGKRERFKRDHPFPPWIVVAG